MDELHAEGVLEGAGEDDVDELDGGGREALSEEVGFEGVDVGGAEPCELDVADGGGDAKVDDGALPFHGGLPPVGDDDLVHPAVEPVAEEDFLGGQVDAFVEGGEAAAELALGAGLCAAPGEELAAALAEGVASEVDGELP